MLSPFQYTALCGAATSVSLASEPLWTLWAFLVAHPQPLLCLAFGGIQQKVTPVEGIPGEALPWLGWPAWPLPLSL